MNEQLLDYYEQELSWVRQRGAEFSRRYPRVAERLGMDRGGVSDPHLERLIESFAFLTARVQQRLDSEYPELADGLLSVVDPVLSSPVPSCALLQLQPPEGAGLAAMGLRVARGSTVRMRLPGTGGRQEGASEVSFRTCMETMLPPIRLDGLTVGGGAGGGEVVRLEFCTALPEGVGGLQLQSLRLYVDGAVRGGTALFDYLVRSVSRVQVVDPQAGNAVLASFPAVDWLRTVGFEPEEALLPVSDRTPHAQRLLLEYAVLPQKFMFLDVGPASSSSALSSLLSSVQGDRFAIELCSDAPRGSLPSLLPEVIKLGCVPVINLFASSARNVPVRHVRAEYEVVPSGAGRASVEVYAIEKVRGFARRDGQDRQQEAAYRSFYDPARNGLSGKQEGVLWHAIRRAGSEGDGGSEVALVFSDPKLDPAAPTSEVLTIDTLCFNGDQPQRFTANGESLRSLCTLEGSGAEVARLVVAPTRVLRPAMGRAGHWRLVGRLSHSWSRLQDSTTALPQLQAFLTGGGALSGGILAAQVNGIAELSCRLGTSVVTGPRGERGVARGYELLLTIDAERFVGSSLWLFVGLVERVLAMSVPVNMYSRVSIQLNDGKGGPVRCLVRSGHRRLL